MKTLNEFFRMGMKRDIPELLEPPGRALNIAYRAINLGAGLSPIVGTESLDYPYWDGMQDDIPAEQNSVGALYAFHFLEHLSGERVIHMLREAERVLVVGGIFNIVVPHRLGALAYQDLDHKSFFTDETWRNLFDNPYYKKHGEWRLRIHLNVTIGINERNLALFTQLVKV